MSRDYDRVVRFGKVDNVVTRLQRGMMPDVQASNDNRQQERRAGLCAYIEVEDAEH